VRVAEHLELDQRVPAEQFARQAQRAHRVVGAVAAGGVGQDREAIGRQEVEQVRLIGVLADVRAPDRDGDDLCAACLDGVARLVEVAVLAGTDQQAGREAAAADDERVGVVHGPA